MSKLVIGVDEAGYGPSMGPLVIGGTAWRVPSHVLATEMGSLLEPEILPSPYKPDRSHVPIGDSKKIYRESHAWDGLTLGAEFLCSERFQNKIDDWEALMLQLAPDDWLRIKQVPWYASKVSNDLYHVFRMAYLASTNASSKLRTCCFELIGIKLRILDEPEFNRQVDATGNKSHILSEHSLNLVRDLANKLANPGESIEVYCDKHGGRNRYQSVLMHCFDQVWFSSTAEGREKSCYSCNWNDHPLQIQFQVGGDSIFPTAAASMVAKWAREQLMKRLNTFWSEKVGTALVPTAGYYVDALRFANDIQTIASQLQLPRESWWRKK